MDPQALATMIAADQAEGLRPALVCATVGTTGTGAVDPVRTFAEIPVPMFLRTTLALIPGLSRWGRPAFTRWISGGAEVAPDHREDPALKAIFAIALVAAAVAAPQLCAAEERFAPLRPDSC